MSSFNTLLEVRFVRVGDGYWRRGEGGGWRATATEPGFEVRLADSVCFVPERELRRAKRRPKK